MLISWLCHAVILPLLRAHFYVTNAQPCGAALLFFRKPAWRRLETQALEHLTASLYTVCTRCKPVYGVHTLRLFLGPVIAPCRYFDLFMKAFLSSKSTFFFFKLVFFVCVMSKAVAQVGSQFSNPRAGSATG